jgi:endonuclease YncB( thermonuclease family)
LLRRLGLAGLSRSRGSEEPRVLEAWKIRPVDGDTFWYGGERIRIRGFDAPERSESGGFEAAQRLEWLLQEGQVVIVQRAVDVYGRTVADVYVDARNVAEVMIAEGYTKPR